MGGKACIRGMRVTAAMLVNQIGAGRSIDQVLADYPYLEREDILQALQYAAWLAEGQNAETQEEGFADTAHCSVSYRVGAQKAAIVKLVLQGYIASKT